MILAELRSAFIVFWHQGSLTKYKYKICDPQSRKEILNLFKICILKYVYLGGKIHKQNFWSIQYYVKFSAINKVIQFWFIKNASAQGDSELHKCQS